MILKILRQPLPVATTSVYISKVVPFQNYSSDWTSWSWEIIAFTCAAS